MKQSLRQNIPDISYKKYAFLLLTIVKMVKLILQKQSQ